MPDNISEILLEVGKTLGETAFMCSIALVIAIVAGGATIIANSSAAISYIFTASKSPFWAASNKYF